MEKKNELDLPTLEEVLEESNVNNTQQTNIQNNNNNNIPPITHIEEKTESTIVPVVNNEITKPQEQITAATENVKQKNETPMFTQELNNSYEENLHKETHKPTEHKELIKRLVLIIICIGAIIIFVPKIMLSTA